MYIAIEGVDKAGKTTLVRKLKENFEAEYLKEPTPALANFIERVKQLEHPDEDNILANLFAADRLLLKPIINKAEKEGRHVITDRSKLSSFAYQGEELFSYNELVNKNMPDPDIVFYIDLPPIISEVRGLESGDKFENKEFLEAVRRIYQTKIRLYCSRNNIQFVEIKGEQNEEDIYHDVIEKLEEIT